MSASAEELKPRHPWLARRLAGLAAGIGAASGRFPATSLAIAVLSILANIEVADRSLLAGVDLQRLTLSLGIAAALSVAATLGAERFYRSRAMPRLVGLLAAGGFGSLAWAAGGSHLFLPLLLPASILAVPLVPHVRGSTSIRFWTFVFWTLLGCSLAFVSVGLFVLGVSAILEMVRYLFGVGLGSIAYRHVFTTALTLVGPLFALGRVPEDVADEVDPREPGRLLAGVKVLADGVAAPLVLTTAAILHVYAAKIALSGDVPVNRIGWIVSTYAAIVLGQRLLAEPFRRTGGAATRAFLRCWPFILAVPLALLAYAVMLRVDGEGWTVERYLLALALSASGLAAGAQILPALRHDARVILAVPTVLLALSSFGPWGVSQVVGRSQSSLILEESAGPHGIVEGASRSGEDRPKLRSRVLALWQADALSHLRPMLDGNIRLPTETGAVQRDAVLTALGLDYGRANETSARSFAAQKAAPFDVSGFDTVYDDLGRPRAENEDGTAAWPEHGRVRLRIGTVADGFDAAAVLSGLSTANGWTMGPDAKPHVLDLTTDAGRHIRLSISAADAEGERLTDLSFDLAIRRAEWQR